MLGYRGLFTGRCCHWMGIRMLCLEENQLGSNPSPTALSLNFVVSGELLFFHLLIFFFSFFFETAFCSCCPDQRAVAQSLLLGSRNSPASASQVAGITGTCHHAQLTFVFLVEMGFHYVVQDGLKFLISGNPSSSAPQSAGITGVSH